MGRIQMFECLEMLLVLFLDMGDGEEVDGYSCMAYRVAPPILVLAM